MDPLAEILKLPVSEKASLGLAFTPKEIAQQPDTWLRTYETVVRLQSELQDFLRRAGVFSDLRNRPSIMLVGAGTSDYVGRSVATLLQRSWQCEVQVSPSTDLLTDFEDLYISGRSYVWISFSRSGDSSEGVAVLELALERYPEIKHIIVSCNGQGRIARLESPHENISRIILNDEVNDRGLAMTSSFSNMVLAGQCLAHIQNLSTYRVTVEDLIATASKLLPAAAIGTEHAVSEGFSRICFLGTGPLHGAAVESALKVLELTAGRVVTFSESFLGLRHGPLSAIDHDTVVVAFVSNDSRRRSYELDLLEEVREKKLAKSMLVVVPAVGVEERERLDNIGINLTLDSSVADCYRPPVDVIVGQLLGLFASMKLGLQPDTPSPNGAINRTVSKVQIY